MADVADRWWLGPTLAVLGGGVWTAHAVVLSGRPEGCVGQGCWASGAANRPTEDLAWLLLVSVAALAVAVVRLGREHSAAAKRLILAGGVLLGVGAALLTGGMAVNAVLPGDSPLWWLHDTDSLGRLVPIAGTFATGLGMVREDRAPRWIGALLVVTSLVSLPFNAQDDRVLLSVPVGLAWMTVGAWWAFRRNAVRQAAVG